MPADPTQLLDETYQPGEGNPFTFLVPSFYAIKSVVFLYLHSDTIIDQYSNICHDRDKERIISTKRGWGRPRIGGRSSWSSVPTFKMINEFHKCVSWEKSTFLFHSSFSSIIIFSCMKDALELFQVVLDLIFYLNYWHWEVGWASGQGQFRIFAEPKNPKYISA